MLLDLASLESVRSFVTEFKQEYSSLDTLVCNAGVWMPMEKKAKTADGFEVSSIGVYRTVISQEIVCRISFFYQIHSREGSAYRQTVYHGLQRCE